MVRGIQWGLTHLPPSVFLYFCPHYDLAEDEVETKDVITRCCAIRLKRTAKRLYYMLFVLQHNDKQLRASFIFDATKQKVDGLKLCLACINSGFDKSDHASRKKKTTVRNRLLSSANPNAICSYICARFRVYLHSEL